MSHDSPAAPGGLTPPATRRVRYLRSAAQLGDIPEDARRAIDEVSSEYVFRVNDYYLGLIDWDDPADPIRQLVIPRREELSDWGDLDASNEAANTVVRGLQHKYRDTALLLVNDVCGAYCRYCFRKRLFMGDNDETTYDLGDAFAYIARHPEISDVLLTGGDPLITSTRKLRTVLQRLAKIRHVRTIRIGSKMPAFNPFRILDDEDLVEALSEVASDRRAVYVMAHFDHPRELTPEARDGIACLIANGVRVVNQCPVIRGINDDAGVLAELFETGTLAGMPQYYLFQGRPTAGNEAYEVPLVEGWSHFEGARRGLSGLSRRVRYSMSHATGKIEVVGVDEERIFMRYHRAKDPDNEGRVLVARRDDEAFWLDQLELLSA